MVNLGLRSMCHFFFVVLLVGLQFIRLHSLNTVCKELPGSFGLPGYHKFIKK